MKQASARDVALSTLPDSPISTGTEGLSSEEARRRLADLGPNLLQPKKRSDAPALLLAQFKSPLVLLLIVAASLSIFLHHATDALIILAIVLVSSLLGFWQERGASNAVSRLLALVVMKASVLRDGREEEIPADEIVPGDVVVLRAGDSVPADAVILTAKDLFVDEAALTGETYPVEKSHAADSALSVSEATNSLRSSQSPSGAARPLRKETSLFMGTHVVSGAGKAIVVRTGAATEFGKVSERLKIRQAENEFEHGVRHFGYLLIEVTLVLVIAIFAINVLRARPPLEAFLFSVALAVGLTPQLLPAVISVNLAHGARRMAREKVIVKRLASIENFGSMDVLCSDKTGTLTEGVVSVQAALGPDGKENEKVLRYAYVNSLFETGFFNPLDDAIRASCHFETPDYSKLDEVPFDFVRKRLSILVSQDGSSLIITKGALANVLAVCTTCEDSSGRVADLEPARRQIQEVFERSSADGLRVVGVAYRSLGKTSVMTPADETGMTFLGLVVLADPPKAGVADTIASLKRMGVTLKVITGDNRLVATSVTQRVGLVSPRVVTGQELRLMSDEALRYRAGDIDVFAEVEPNQKERIILALRKSGRVVGHLGDGINDASALHAADVGISVNGAVDVAKEAADIVLLEKDLGVLCFGIQEGRRTFANTLKYVFMATSANFGNMFSMAGISIVLPFLPLLPKQILLTNLLTDIPEMTIATDTVDAEMVTRPRRWDIGFIRRFMVTFGILSSVFDFLTFGVLLILMRATPDVFRTGWFIESVISASAVVLVIRTRRHILSSVPSRYLLAATCGVIAIAAWLPFTPLAGIFGFQPIRPAIVLAVAGIVVIYLSAAEATKRLFYRLVRF